MIRHLRDRVASKALQAALERYEALLAAGSKPAEARIEATRSLDADLRTAFALATAFPPAVEADPDPAFARSLEAKLRAQPMPRPVARPRFSLQPALALAAAIIVLGAFLVPAMRSLPGDPLYALKTASENGRLFVASGAGEARVRLDLANERFREVEGLVARSRLRFVGVGTSAAAAPDNVDPKLAALIRSTLQSAADDVAQAAAIIIEQPHDVSGLDQLLQVTQRGQSIAANVAAVVPHQDKPPVLKTLVSLAKIEAQANAARMTAGPATTPEPCATPTSAPTATPDESPTATPSDTPATSPTESPTSTPTATPTATPTETSCGGPTPVPAPTQTPGADDNVTTTSEPTASPSATPSDTPPTAGGDNTDSRQGQSAPHSPAILAGTSG